MRLIYLNLIVLMLFSCRTTALLSPQQPIPDDTLISLKRSVCYGSCPDYTVTISSDGTVIFEGRKFVKMAGIHKGSISRDIVRQLIAEFDKENFFSLNDSYRSAKDGCPEEWTDAPTVVTSIKIDGRFKSIDHYHGCEQDQGNSIYPKGLTNLENAIDKLAAQGNTIT
jgi:hypothetical protein